MNEIGSLCFLSVPRQRIESASSTVVLMSLHFHATFFVWVFLPIADPLMKVESDTRKERLGEKKTSSSPRLPNQ